MRRAELLINESRRASENLEFSDETGIQDSEFLRYLNDAQDRVYQKILSVHPDIFEEEDIQSVVVGQEAYDIPSLAYLKAKLELVEYSPTGRTADYYPLDKGRLRERYSGNPGQPSGYIRRDRQILIQPAPNNGSGKIRQTYYKKLPKIDVRRGQVSAVTLDGSTNTITSLTIDTTSLLTDDFIEAIQELGYISVVDKDGEVQMRGIPVSSINSTTGLVTLDGSFEYEDGETIAVNDYIVMGQYSTSHSYLDDSCERYLLAHCDWKILKRDSSNDSVEQNQELKDMLDEIVQAYADVDEDIQGVPIIDTDYLDMEGNF